jgi:predicted nucleic acid-binding protein
MSRVYLDACCIIYLVEASSPFHDAIVERLLRYRRDAAARLLTSRLSCLECRVRPTRDRDRKLLATYDRFFNTSRLLIAEVTPGVIERATTLRARYGFRTPDAIHLASAIEEQADVFLTGDGTLSRCVEVRVEMLAKD